MSKRLNSICTYRNEKSPISEIDPDTYISTDSMLSNRGGFSSTRSLPPASKVSLYKVGDTLVSNIRPYFKKIWLSDRNGGCSNDILIFRPNANCDSEYLYWLLSSDTFFNYMMATSKGTKMPRGDKLAIMHYKVPNYSVEVQKRIVCILHPIQKKIALNRNINGYLTAQAARCPRRQSRRI